MPVRITATLVSRRLSSTILALRSPLGVRCLRSDQAITFRATMALGRDTAQAAAKRRMMVRALSICYKVPSIEGIDRDPSVTTPHPNLYCAFPSMTPVELLQQLIRFDTTNPPGNESECVGFVR